MLREIPSGTDTLVLSGDFPAPPETVFRFWTEPALLTQWWASDAEIEPREGGAYLFSWPQMDWRLRGRYLAFDPNRRIAFTWAWDHEPDTPERRVEVHFDPAGDGTRVTITHGPYGASSGEQEDRQSHLEGWQYFAGRLVEALGSG